MYCADRVFMPRFVTHPDRPHSPVRMGIRPVGFLNEYQKILAGLPWPGNDRGGTNAYIRGEGDGIGGARAGAGGDGGGVGKGGGDVESIITPNRANLVLYLQRPHGRARGVEPENERALLASINAALMGTPFSLKVFNSSGDWRRDRPLFASAAAVVRAARRVRERFGGVSWWLTATKLELCRNLYSTQTHETHAYAYPCTRTRTHAYTHVY